MKRVFADTSYFLALVNPDDPQHGPAQRWSRRSRVELVVTEFVLIELGNSLSHGSDRTVFKQLLELLRTDAHVTIVPVSSEVLDRGLRLFAQRDDKQWSVTDCTSFQVMSGMGLTEALTADHHFRQAGFRVLLG
jgi:predicted nucleic acid-binding protein